MKKLRLFLGLIFFFMLISIQPGQAGDHPPTNSRDPEILEKLRYDPVFVHENPEASGANYAAPLAFPLAGIESPQAFSWENKAIAHEEYNPSTSFWDIKLAHPISQGGYQDNYLTYDAPVDMNPSCNLKCRQVAFSSNRSSHYEIWVINADGSGLAQLTNLRKTSAPGHK